MLQTRILMMFGVGGDLFKVTQGSSQSDCIILFLNWNDGYMGINNEFYDSSKLCLNFVPIKVYFFPVPMKLFSLFNNLKV